MKHCELVIKFECRGNNENVRGIMATALSDVSSEDAVKAHHKTITRAVITMTEL